MTRTKRLRSLLAVAAGVATAACATAPLTLSLAPTVDYGSGQQIDLAVELVIPEDLPSVTEEFFFFYDLILPIGSAVAKCSPALAQSVFRDAHQVEIGRSGHIAKQAAIPTLTPRIANVYLDQPVWGWSELGVDVSIEWSLVDSRGELVWIETLTGSGRGVAGSRGSYEANITAIAEDAIRAAMIESARAMRESVEIRTFAKESRAGAI